MVLLSKQIIIKHFVTKIKEGNIIDKNFVKIIMNPVRQRIVQYLILHEKGTPKEIGEELSDIPTASLYRHIKTLFSGGCIEVLEEKQVRGTVEKTYGLVKRPMGDTPQKEDIAYLIQASLLSIMASFQQYFLKEEADPVKDMLSLTTSTLMLSDEEYMEMTAKMGAVISEYVYNKPEDGRKPRRFTFITSPYEDK